ncbi:MAG: hypothetical protein PWP03_637 [Candidatus Woesearchaeota archaeon]|nr:hypothetical protein [Candidatus Woesearchaeota archaeon]
MIDLLTLIQNLPRSLFVNVFVIMLILFYIYFFFNYQLFSPIFKTLRKNKLFFFSIFLLMLFLSFINGWHSKIYYYEPEIIVNSLMVFRHLFPRDIYPCPLGFAVLISFFNTESYFYSQLVGRFVSFLSTFFSSVVLFMIFRRFNVDKKLSYLFVFLFSIAPYNIYYLTLNKPESLAVFFLLFFIYLFHVYVFDKRKDLFWPLYILSLLLSLIRYELIILTFFFFIFFVLHSKRKVRHYILLYIILIIFIFLGSILIFSGENSYLKNEENLILFNLKNILNSFFLKIIKTFWLILFIFYLFFILRSLKFLKKKKQIHFFLFLFFLFIFFILIYSTYDYSYHSRYEKMIYPFLFIGLSVLNRNNSSRTSKISDVVFLLFVIIFVIFSISNYFSIRHEISNMLITDKILIDLQKNKFCFKSSLLYSPVYLPKSLMEDLNFVKIMPSLFDYSYFENIYNKKYEKLRYLYLIEHFTLTNPSNIPKEILSLRGTKENYDKLTKFCPGLSNETKSYLIFLDKPLSQYFK